MGRGTIHLTGDRDLIDRAKIQGINLSQFFEETLRLRLNMPDIVNESEPLDQQIAKVEVEISERQRALATLHERKKKIKEEKEKRIIKRIPIEFA